MQPSACCCMHAPVSHCPARFHSVVVWQLLLDDLHCGLALATVTAGSRHQQIHNAQLIPDVQGHGACYPRCLMVDSSGGLGGDHFMCCELSL